MYLLSHWPSTPVTSYQIQDHIKQSNSLKAFWPSMLHRSPGTSASILGFTQICLNFSTRLTSFSCVWPPKVEKDFLDVISPFSLPFSLLVQKKIILYLNFLVSILFTFLGAIILTLMIYRYWLNEGSGGGITKKDKTVGGKYFYSIPPWPAFSVDAPLSCSPCPVHPVSHMLLIHFLPLFLLSQ